MTKIARGHMAQVHDNSDRFHDRIGVVIGHRADMGRLTHTVAFPDLDDEYLFADTELVERPVVWLTMSEYDLAVFRSTLHEQKDSLHRSIADADPGDADELQYQETLLENVLTQLARF